MRAICQFNCSNSQPPKPARPSPRMFLHRGVFI
jgi:hypothetical protein